MNDKLKLLEPISIGDLHLPNRVFMSPLTRCRASAGRVPNTMMRDYYVQRASVGLIISEATSVTPMGVGYPNTPGIWSPEQTAGWKQITTAVHAAGGRIFAQLAHSGAVSHPDFFDGAAPLGLRSLTDLTYEVALGEDAIERWPAHRRARETRDARGRALERIGRRPQRGRSPPATHRSAVAEDLVLRVKRDAA